MLSYQGVVLFEKIRRIRRCAFVEGSVLLGMGFEVSQVHDKPRSLSLFLSLCLSLSLSLPLPPSLPPFLSLSRDQNLALSYCTMIPVIKMID